MHCIRRNEAKIIASTAAAIKMSMMYICQSLQNVPCVMAYRCRFADLTSAATYYYVYTKRAQTDTCYHQAAAVEIYALWDLVTTSLKLFFLPSGAWCGGSVILRVFMCTLTKFYSGWFFNFLGNILTIRVNFSRIGEFLATALPSSAADLRSGWLRAMLLLKTH